MLIETEVNNNELVVSLHEKRLDASIAADFQNTVCEKLSDTVSNVIIDLSELEFIDSSGLGSIVAIKKTAAQGVGVNICCTNTDVINVFRLTRMDKVFGLYDSVTTAKAA